VCILSTVHRKLQFQVSCTQNKKHRSWDKMQETFNICQWNLNTLQYCSHTVLWTEFKCPPRWRVNCMTQVKTHNSLVILRIHSLTLHSAITCKNTLYIFQNNQQLGRGQILSHLLCCSDCGLHNLKGRHISSNSYALALVSSVAIIQFNTLSPVWQKCFRLTQYVS
jgi:hypothetical protein